MTERRRWRLAWKFSFRAAGWLLAFVGGALLFARLLTALANLEAAEATFASFEVVVPLVAGMHAALLFAPDDEPALELLLAMPRPPVYLIYERLGVLAALQGGLALALSALTAAATGASFLDILVAWLPPAMCIVGLCLLATLIARRTAFGLLTAIVICVAMGLGREVILPRFPNLWPFVFYVDPRSVTAEQYFINRAVLLGVGVGALALTLYRMRDEERLLGFQEAKNG